MFFLLLLMGLLGCGSEPATDPCDEWTWIEEESCLMDICGDEDAGNSECRAGECWCCNDDECWSPQ